MRTNGDHGVVAVAMATADERGYGRRSVAPTLDRPSTPRDLVDRVRSAKPVDTKAAFRATVAAATASVSPLVRDRRDVTCPTATLIRVP